MHVDKLIPYVLLGIQSGMKNHISWDKNSPVTIHGWQVDMPCVKTLGESSTVNEQIAMENHHPQ